MNELSHGVLNFSLSYNEKNQSYPNKKLFHAFGSQNNRCQTIWKTARLKTFWRSFSPFSRSASQKSRCIFCDQPCAVRSNERTIARRKGEEKSVLIRFHGLIFPSALRSLLAIHKVLLQSDRFTEKNFISVKLFDLTALILFCFEVEECENTFVF